MAAPSFFFLTLLLLLSTQIQARDSYFFGKFRRDNNNVVPVEETTNPIPQNTQPQDQNQNQNQNQDQNPTFIPDSNNGYGLYSHDTESTSFNNKYDDKFNSKPFSTPSLTETEEDSAYNNNNKFNTKTFSTPSLTETEEDSAYNNKYDQKYPNEKTESYENDNGYTNGYNGYENSNERDLYKSNAYGEELEGERGYKGYTSHNLEREGMSDTRFMEKGKYYYDVYNPRNHGHFYQKTRPSTSYNPAGFKDPYDSKWEKEQEQVVPQEFQEEQVDRFNP